MMSAVYEEMLSVMWYGRYVTDQFGGSREGKATGSGVGANADRIVVVMTTTNEYLYVKT